MTTLHITGYVEAKFSRTITGESYEDCIAKLRQMDDENVGFIYSDQKIIERHPFLDFEVNLELDGKETGVTIEDESGNEVSVESAVWLHDQGVSGE